MIQYIDKYIKITECWKKIEGKNLIHINLKLMYNINWKRITWNVEIFQIWMIKTNVYDNTLLSFPYLYYNILSTVYVSQQAAIGNTCKWCTVDILHFLSFCTNDILQREV